MKGEDLLAVFILDGPGCLLVNYTELGGLDLRYRFDVIDWCMMDIVGGPSLRPLLWAPT